MKDTSDLVRNLSFNFSTHEMKESQYLRYHLLHAKTDALVQTQEETATPAPNTAIR